MGSIDDRWDRSVRESIVKNVFRLTAEELANTYGVSVKAIGNDSTANRWSAP